MKSTKKLVSIMLAATMLVSGLTATLVTVNAAATSASIGGKYATNPNGNVGIKKTITVDGSISDWDSSMLIAQGTANDDPRVYRQNSMYEKPIDMYAMYACWDDSNLYLMWEYTNVQDIVAPNDDFPLTQGNLWIDNLPVFLAIDSDPLAGGNGVFTTASSVWDSGITFDEGVDTLIAFSTNGSNGPFIYDADKATGKFSYDSVISYADTGITLKWGNGILEDSVIGIDKAYGTYNNRVPGDVLLDSSDWVDFNALGHDSDTLDMHYEMSIPLSKLGITASDIANNGIGALMVSTFGTSGMDCLPYDSSMYDNADQAYSQQEFNSMEKEDEDHITVPFARIGKLSGGQSTTQPTTAQPTTAQPTTAQPTTAQPTTAKPTTAPTTSAVDTLTITATSNLFPEESLTISENTDSVTVNFDIKSVMKLVNGQWVLNFDTTKLSFDSTKNTDLMPYITETIVNPTGGVIKGNFSEITNPYDFSTSKRFVSVVFDVIGTGSTEVSLDVEELSVGYLTNGILEYRNAYVNSNPVNLSGVSGFTTSSISGITTIVVDGDVKYGDVNGDGNINVLDATEIQKHLAGLVTLTAEQLAVSDTDHDGRVSIKDATQIQKYIAGIVSSL